VSPNQQHLSSLNRAYLFTSVMNICPPPQLISKGRHMQRTTITAALILGLLTTISVHVQSTPAPTKTSSKMKVFIREKIPTTSSYDGK
jgi:hypothetical protein